MLAGASCALDDMANVWWAEFTERCWHERWRGEVQLFVDVHECDMSAMSAMPSKPPLKPPQLE
jgi:hypothetical protein